MSPNQTIKFETKIGLFEGNEKAKIAQIFIHNEYDESSYNDNNNITDIEINRMKESIRSIDASKIKDPNKKLLLYQQIQCYLFFYDVSNSSSSLNDLGHFYKEANTACNGDFKFAVVAYGGSLTKANEIKRKLKCGVFEVN